MTDEPILPPTPPTPPPDFMDTYGKMVVRLIIVAVIIVGAVIYARTGTEMTNTATNTTTSTNGTGLTVTGDKATNPELKVTPGTPATSDKGPQITMEQGKVTVTAVRGNGLTHLARRATAEYLSARGTQGIKAEHKIFIEDYLRKHAPPTGSIHTGTQVSFQETDIQHAIELSLKLTEAQLQNLHQYVVQVPGL